MTYWRTGAAIGVLLSLSLGRSLSAAPPPGLAMISGIDTEYIDHSVRPQDDIYRYLNGKWLASFQIPADQVQYGTDNLLYDQTQDQLRELIETAAKDTRAKPASDEGKIRDLYNSFMDEARVESLASKPLSAELARIDALQSTQDLPALMAHLSAIGVSTPIAANVHLDNKDSSKYVFDLGQSGLGLPDRDYYLQDEDAKLHQIKQKYQAHIVSTLQLQGDADAAKEASDVVALETELAKVQWTQVENRDPIKAYNKVQLGELTSLSPGFDWPRYLAAAGVDGKITYVIVSQPSYLTGFAKLALQTPVPVWRSYLRWHLISSYSPYLSKAYVDERFDFYGTTLRGVPQIRPRWKRGVMLVDASVGEILGKVYVAKYFPADRKSRADQLVRNLLKVFRQDITQLDWMSRDTKKEALVKLAKINSKIGYPSKWRDYSGLELRPDDLVGNVTHVNEFEYRRNINKLGKPVDRNEWDMTPQTINAYYDPEKNEIVFPAAILQAPFFDVAAEDAANYGAIGAIIGHEISHAFDDQGSQYDGDGNLRDWWSREDHERFGAKTQALVGEYSAFEPVAGYHLNGELTLGENIADNSGLAIAYKAYKLSLAGKSAPVIDSLSGDQRFYLAFTQGYREKMRDNMAIELIKSDPHSMAVDRVLGSLVNQPGFYQAFDLKPGDGMYRAPDQRIIIW